MAVVISKCRQTGNHAFLAVEVNPLMLERSGGPFACAYCPFCDRMHTWYVEDSRLAGRRGSTTPGLREVGGGGSIYR
jgi:hypothetical protein